MGTLKNAPLIEVGFEILWGKVTTSGDMVQKEFTEADRRIYFGEFGIGASAAGFKHRENMRPIDAVPPHVVLDRYRKGAGRWPCYQTGVGVVTVNQINSGYEWVTFASDVRVALEILDTCESLGGLSGLTPVGVELRYQDGFILDSPDAPISFLRDKLDFGLKVPDLFHQHQDIAGTASNSRLSFQYETTNPVGHILVDVQQALINGRDGYVMNLSLTSGSDNAPNYVIDDLMQWLEKAHTIQQHTFRSLVKDKYLQILKGEMK